MNDKTTDKTIILHLGAHKTATTSAQICCRNNLTELRRHGLVFIDHTDKEFSTYRIIRGTCQAARGERTLEKAPEKFEMLRSSLQRQLAHPTVNSLLIPWEIFLGEPYYQGHAGFYPKSAESIDALYRLFDGFSVRVIYTVRDQWDFVNSWYQQLQKLGRRLAPEPYRDWALAADLSWRPLIANLAAAFGAAQVEVLDYASPDHANPDILARILRTYGVPIPSLSGPQDTFQNKAWPKQAMEIAAFAMPKLNAKAVAELRLLPNIPPHRFASLMKATEPDFLQNTKKIWPVSKRCRTRPDRLAIARLLGRVSSSFDHDLIIDAAKRANLVRRFGGWPIKKEIRPATAAVVLLDLVQLRARLRYN